MILKNMNILAIEKIKRESAIKKKLRTCHEKQIRFVIHPQLFCSTHPAPTIIARVSAGVRFLFSREKGNSMGGKNCYSSAYSLRRGNDRFPGGIFLLVVGIFFR